MYLFTFTCTCSYESYLLLCNRRCSRWRASHILHSLTWTHCIALESSENWMWMCLYTWCTQTILYMYNVYYMYMYVYLHLIVGIESLVLWRECSLYKIHVHVCTWLVSSFLNFSYTYTCIYIGHVQQLPSELCNSDCVWYMSQTWGGYNHKRYCSVVHPPTFMCITVMYMLCVPEAVRQAAVLGRLVVV